MDKKKHLAVVDTPISSFHIDTANIPVYVGQNLAQMALLSIQEAYADPEIQADFRRWKAEREAEHGKTH